MASRSRNPVFAVVSALAWASHASAGNYEIIKSGVEKKPGGGSRTITVNETVTVGPYDRILVTVWTKNAGHRHEYQLKDDLALTVAGGSPPGSPKAPVHIGWQGVASRPTGARGARRATLATGRHQFDGYRLVRCIT